VGHYLLIAAFGTMVLLALWHCCWAHSNRRRGERAIQHLEAACAGQVEITNKRWCNTRRLQAQLRIAAHWLANARITIQMMPRAIPVHWVVAIWRKQRETLTLEADLDYAPSLHLDLFRHRWLTHKHVRPSAVAENWSVLRPGPVVLTTRTQWSQELTPVVNTLMTSRGHNLLSVRFRHNSPHLSATIDLEALSDEQAATSFLNVLRELAAGASAQRH
jgi:hypothetical protein